LWRLIKLYIFKEVNVKSMKKARSQIESWRKGKITLTEKQKEELAGKLKPGDPLRCVSGGLCRPTGGPECGGYGG
jgi:hypothetical protein